MPIASQGTAPATQPSQNGSERPARVLVLLLNRSEEDHGGVDPEQRHERGGVADAGQRGDQHDHQARRERVLDPPEVVAALFEPGDVAVEERRTGDEPVEQGGKGEEACHSLGERQVEQDRRFPLGTPGRSLQVGGRDGGGEVVRECQHGHRLGGVKSPHRHVGGAEASGGNGGGGHRRGRYRQSGRRASASVSLASHRFRCGGREEDVWMRSG
jgi:hypothetical protein